FAVLESLIGRPLAEHLRGDIAAIRTAEIDRVIHGPQAPDLSSRQTGLVHAMRDALSLSRVVRFLVAIEISEAKQVDGGIDRTPEAQQGLRQRLDRLVEVLPQFLVVIQEIKDVHLVLPPLAE